jgi:H+/Cl- antiporter ClcA
MNMPLTAIVLTLEFTRVGYDFLIPISLAVAGSISVFHLCSKYAHQPNRGSATTSTTAHTAEN